MKRVLVYLSTYNGEKYLRPLLDSVLAQEGVAVDLYVRDDGSKDSTLKILSEYAEKSDSIRIEIGGNVGYAKSFWKLFGHENEYDYYAFCDQDDIWLKDKLSRAVELLEREEQSLPLLYTSDVTAVNNELEIIDDRLFKVEGTLNFYQSLQKSIVPGCTFVFNREAFAVLRQYNGYMESHDWAAYCIVTAFGKIIFDNTTHIYYRMHGQNTIGKTSRFNDFAKKLTRFFHAPLRVRSRFAKDFYDCYHESLQSDYADAARALGYYRIDKKKNRILMSKKFKGLTFKILVLLGRV